MRPNRDSSFFAAYHGPSMEPTLREPGLMEVVPYRGTAPQIGDVVFFEAPDEHEAVVHRIVRIGPSGIFTRGDNNNLEDAYALRSEDLLGRVVAVWLGQKRRAIPGGLRGRLRSHWLRSRRRPADAASRALSRPYHTLSRSGLVARLLPPRLRPRVVVAPAHSGDHLALLFFGRVIGHFDEESRRWRIRRPLRLLVREDVLRHSLGAHYRLALADNARWSMTAGDEGATAALARFAECMQLPVIRTRLPAKRADAIDRRLLVISEPSVTEARAAPAPSGLSWGDRTDAVCLLPSDAHADLPYLRMLTISSCIVRDTQARGGVVLHGALAERQGKGVIMAAPGGTGKSTASERLPPPWRSLCDDATLVVRDPSGAYWAHPWPTWSSFLGGGEGGTWEVERGLPLAATFFLSQSQKDGVEPLGPGHALTLLVECAEQSSSLITRGLDRQELRALRLERFDNLCGLAEAVPAYVLHISLTGAFWQEIERVLGAS